MTVYEIYDRVSRRIGDTDERTYLAYLGDTLLELRATVEQKYLWLNGVAPPPEALTPDEVWCNSLFHPAIIDNILFLFTGEEKYKSEFLRKTEAALETARKNAAGSVTMRKYSW